MHARENVATYAFSSGRRGAIDVARTGALVVVVLGHLAMAVIDRGPDGQLRGANLLALHPDLVWLAALAPMPVFFAAAGWANAAATVSSAAPRLRALVGLGAAVVAAWFVATAIEILVRGQAGLVGDAARVATRPLWFLAVYVPFAALGLQMSRLARRPILAVGVCLAVLAALDVTRFWLGRPGEVGWPGFFVAWGVPWLLGAWWRHRWEAGGFREQSVGATIAAGALATAAALVAWAGYHPALIDVVSGKRSNTTPPTLYTAIAAVAQVGVLMVAARWFDLVAARWRRTLDRAGPLAVGVYVWHLTALALCASAVALGLWAPKRSSAAWWIARPPWFVAVFVVTGLLVAATAYARTFLRHHLSSDHRRRMIGKGVLWAGVAASTVGAATVGLKGPATPLAGLAALLLFVAGWWWLGAKPVNRDGAALPVATMLD